MGTSNFYYRDTLYATPEGCDYAYGCPYYEVESRLIADIKRYSKAESDYIIHSMDQELVDDECHFDGRVIGSIVGRIYKEFEISHPLACNSIYFTVGDDFCLRHGYNSGFNFDRTQPQSLAIDYSTDDEYGINDFVWEAIDSGLFWDILPYDEDLTDDDVDEYELQYELQYELLGIDDIKEGIHDRVMGQVMAFIAESDRIYHKLGEKYFGIPESNVESL